MRPLVDFTLRTSERPWEGQLSAPPQIEAHRASQEVTGAVAGCRQESGYLLLFHRLLQLLQLFPVECLHRRPDGQDGVVLAAIKCRRNICPNKRRDWP